jgi:RimJ/RimL family protein N-acetyltransferase
MSGTIAWPSARLIQTERLDLETLRVEHAQEAAALLNDTRLHTFTGGSPATLDELAARYVRLSAGQSPHGSQAWLNWLVRDRSIGQIVGTVQATVERSVPDRLEAELAWVIGVPHQHKGYGRDAAFAMATWLREHGVAVLRAHIHPSHEASAAIARALGMAATDIRIDGEIRCTGT